MYIHNIVYRAVDETAEKAKKERKETRKAEKKKKEDYLSEEDGEGDWTTVVGSGVVAVCLVCLVLNLHCFIVSGI